MLLRNQVIDLDEPPPTPLAEKSVAEVVKETFQQVPEGLNNMLGQIGEAWSDPGKVISEAAEKAERIWSDVKDGE
jgi:hypothetical protein